MSVTGMREARQATLHRSQAQAMAAPGMLEEELRRLAANHRPEWSGRRPIMRSSADTSRGL